MMNRNSKLKMLRLIGCMVLMAAMALFCIGCSSAPKANDTAASKAFTVEVTDLDGNKESFDYTTDKATVGEALLAEGLIAGDVGEYGLYVTTVNGITLDWDTDQMYWAFYIDGEYATTSVDLTEIAEGSVYAFIPQA